LIIEYSGQFKKDVKKVRKREKDLGKFKEVTVKLSNQENLPPKFKDHKLSGPWENYRECHIKPDLLLIYRIINESDTLSLARLGSHSDLFE